MNLNKVFLIGRLTANPVLRSTTGGSSVGSFSIATNRVWNDKDGKKQEEVQFHNIVVWGKQADIVSRYLVKGQMVLVEGRLQTRSYEAKDGGGKRYATEIVADRVQFGPKAGSGGSMPSGEASGTEDQESETPVAAEIPTITIDEEINPEDLEF